MPLHLVKRADADDREVASRPRLPRRRWESKAGSGSMSTPQWTTMDLRACRGAALLARSRPGCSARSRDEDAASATFSQSIRRSTWRSEPCAVKLYGIPVRRWMIEAGQRGMVCEVAVHVCDADLLHEAGGVRHLRKDPDRAGEEVQASRRPADQCVRRRRDSAGDPASQYAWLARIGPETETGSSAHARRAARPPSCRVSGCSAQQGVHLDRGARSSSGEHLDQHEGLAELREARHDVRDGDAGGARR